MHFVFMYFLRLVTSRKSKSQHWQNIFMSTYIFYLAIIVNVKLTTVNMNHLSKKCNFFHSAAIWFCFRANREPIKGKILVIIN